MLACSPKANSAYSQHKKQNSKINHLLALQAITPAMMAEHSAIIMHHHFCSYSARPAPTTAILAKMFVPNRQLPFSVYSYHHPSRVCIYCRSLLRVVTPGGVWSPPAATKTRALASPAQVLNAPDFHCHLVSVVKDKLTHSVISVNKKLTLKVIILSLQNSA